MIGSKMATVTSSLSAHHFARTMGSTDGSMDSNDISNHYSGRESPSIENNSCCSDDTVLSVGNENLPITHENLSFKNIESHLNAISQLTQNALGAGGDSIKSLSPSPISPSPSSTKSMSMSGSPTPSYTLTSDSKSSPTSPSMDSYMMSNINPLFRPCHKSRSGSPSPDLQQQKSQRSPEQHFFFRQTPVPKVANSDNNNEQLQNTPGLKFSIDNILKADFGRRITEPINIKKSKPKKVVVSAQSSAKPSVDDSPSVKATGAVPVDLSKAEAEKTSATGSTSTMESSSSSSQPMLWPAWVYCTRYSDRPSSGRFSSCKIHNCRNKLL